MKINWLVRVKNKMKINWIVRMKNRAFWVALIPAVLLLAQAVGDVFGVSFDFGQTGDKLLNVVNTLFALLTILGVVTDPTTDGVNDSQTAMTYQVPKKEM